MLRRPTYGKPARAWCDMVIDSRVDISVHACMSYNVDSTGKYLPWANWTVFDISRVEIHYFLLLWSVAYNCLYYHEICRDYSTQLSTGVTAAVCRIKLGKIREPQLPAYLADVVQNCQVNFHSFADDSRSTCTVRLAEYQLPSANSKTVSLKLAMFDCSVS